MTHLLTQAYELHHQGQLAFQRGQYQEAIALYRQALRHQPAASFYFDLGLAYFSLQQLDDASSACQHALVLDPSLAEAYYQLAYSFSLRGRSDEAMAACSRALLLQPVYPEACHTLGYSHLVRGHLKDAILCFQRAMVWKPDLAKAYYNLGIALTQQDKLNDALASYHKTLVLQPDFFKAHYNLGTVFQQLGKPHQALISYQDAIAIQPDFAEAYSGLGKIFPVQGKPEEAVAAYRKALLLKPDQVEAHYHLGVVLQVQGKLQEALACYHRTLALNPGFVDAHSILGLAYAELNELDKAVVSYQQVLMLQPHHAQALCNLGTTLYNLGKPSEASTHYRQALALWPDYGEVYSNELFVLHYLPTVSSAEIFHAHGRYAERFESPLKPAWPVHTRDRSPDRRLKIGYVSPDFRLHSVAFFIEPLLAHHDKAQVEVYAYYNYPQNDAVTDRLKTYVDHWIPCHPLSDDALAQRIQADQIDLLVDLAGHTRIHRLLTFARKPAPIQVSYLGYVSTTGLSAIDYRLSTLDLDPLGNDAYNTESLFRLPNTLWCFRPPGDAPEVSFPTPAQTHGVVTFASFNKLTKVSEPALQLWAQLLLALPNARLLFAGLPEGSARQHLLHRFAQYGLPSDRLVLHGKLSHAAFRQLHHEVDLALDPFPYNGNTTTCESLWMGVPVISLCGEAFVSRFGYALLKTLGLHEFIAFSPEQYLHIALSLARNLPRLSALRQSLRTRFLASPLRQEADLARAVELAYRAMWHTWCRTP